MGFIEFDNVSKQYKNGVTALYDLNLSIEKGDFVFIIGGSGSGKSTLIKLLYREEKPTKGKIMVGGINVSKLRNRKVYKLRRKLGIVFQDYRLLPKLTVYENVSFALEAIGEKKSEIRPKVLKALELVGLKNKVREYPDNLAGGEQQRVAIARAIVNDPPLLICDEPTGNLDPARSLEIVKLIEEINKKVGTTVLMVTHDEVIVNKMKKHVIALKDGHLFKDYKKGEYINEVL
jgi:cell division transport system ATP-binding protein